MKQKVRSFGKARSAKAKAQLTAIAVAVFLAAAALLSGAGEQKTNAASNSPGEDLGAVIARMKAAKADVAKRHSDLLNARYDLSSRAAQGVTMSRGKAVQEGVRVKLPAGLNWDQWGR
jgi:hypothetical protein